MVDQRLATLGTDYIDFFFIHGLGDDNYGGIEKSIKFIKSPEFRQVADKIRSSGKAKFIGFSAHHAQRAQLIQAAAEDGVIDAIMLQYRPWLEKDSAAQQGDRRGLEQGDRPDLDEADRQPDVRRQAQGRHPQGGRRARAGAGREEADAVPGPAARDLDRRADQRLLRLDEEHGADPRERRRRDAVRAAEDGRHPRTPRRVPGARPDALRRLRRPTARSPPAPRPSSAT